MKSKRRAAPTRNPVLKGLHAITRRQVVPDKRAKLHRQRAQRELGGRELARRA